MIRAPEQHRAQREVEVDAVTDVDGPNSPERIVHLGQKWEKAEETGWQVRLDLAALESGLGRPQ